MEIGSRAGSKPKRLGRPSKANGTDDEQYEATSQLLKLGKPAGQGEEILIFEVGEPCPPNLVVSIVN